MATYDDFWNRYLPQVGPGLLDFGVGLYNKRQGQNEAASRLSAAQGPLYGQYMGAAGTTLGQAGGFDPQAFAADRFNAQQQLLNPVYDKQLGDLMSTLRARGQLGISTYNPGVPGITPNGTPMNPQLAAFFAAQNAQRSKDAYNSLGAGQDYLDNLVKRAGMLQGGANATQNTGIAAQSTQPSRAAGNAELLKGLTGVLKNSNAVKQIPGMIGGGIDWLKGVFNPEMPAAPAPTDFTGFEPNPYSDFSFETPQMYDFGGGSSGFAGEFPGMYDFS